MRVSVKNGTGWTGRAVAVAAVAALLLGACGEGGDTGEGAAAGVSDTGVAATTPPNVAKAKEQAAKFRTLGMPDDWLNFGAFYTSVCTTYDLGCTGSGTGPNRQDTDMSSAEEIAAFADEPTNPALCADIGIFFGQVAEAEGVTLDYLPEAAAKLPAPYKAATGGWVATGVGVISILANEDRLAQLGVAPPKSFADLLEPRYKGLVSMSDPTSSGTGQATVFSAAAALGGGEVDLDAAFDYFKELRGNLTQLEYSNDLLEKGDIPIALRYDFVGLIAAAAMQGRGVNATVTVPAEGGIYAPSATMCNANTDKPDLAKLVLDHSLSDEGQLAFAEYGARPVRYVLGDLDVPDAAKAGWLPDSQYAKVISLDESQGWPDPADIAERWENEVLA